MFIQEKRFLKPVKLVTDIVLRINVNVEKFPKGENGKKKHFNIRNITLIFNLTEVRF